MRHDGPVNLALMRDDDPSTSGPHGTEEALQPLPGLSEPKDWDGHSPPDRRFILDSWIVRGSAGLLGGQDGVGKSLLAQQMATCAASGTPFLGLPMERVRTVYVTCEDPAEELHRRQEAINHALNVPMGTLQGWLRSYSLKGQLNNEFATFDQSGRMIIESRYKEVRQAALDFGAGLVFVDNAAHVFAGNENARHDVAAFLGLLERLSEEIDGAVILLAHPNKAHGQGHTAGNEYSGSTGWSAHVRNRLFLDRDRPDDGAAADPDKRVLRRSKANYAASGEEIECLWFRWAFVRPDDVPENSRDDLAQSALAATENDRFLACLDRLTVQRRATSDSPNASNYAPKIMAAMTEARGMKKAAFAAAMNRLFSLDMIAAKQSLWRGADRKPVLGIARLEAREGGGRSSLSDCNPLQDGSAVQLQEGAGRLPRNGGNPCGTVREEECPIYKYNGAASEAAAPDKDEGRAS